MNIKKITANGNEIAIINNDDVLISDVQSALDFMMTVNYEKQVTKGRDTL